MSILSTELKVCNKCKEPKPLAAFPKRRDNPLRPDAWCHDCYRQNTRIYRATKPIDEQRRMKAERDKRVRKVRINILIDYLLEHPCVDCGNSDLEVLDFDHVRGEKYREVAAMFHAMYSLNRVFDEIAKCEVVCANCHRKRTARRGKGWLRSGKV